MPLTCAPCGRIGREVVAHAAAAAHRLGRLVQRHVDADAVLVAGYAVAHRLDKAIDECGLEVRVKEAYWLIPNNVLINMLDSNPNRLSSLEARFDYLNFEIIVSILKEKEFLVPISISI